MVVLLVLKVRLVDVVLVWVALLLPVWVSLRLPLALLVLRLLLASLLRTARPEKLRPPPAR